MLKVLFIASDSLNHEMGVNLKLSIFLLDQISKLQSSRDAFIMPHSTGISCDRLWYLFTWVCCKQIMQKQLKVLYIVSLKLSIEKTKPQR